MCVCVRVPVSMTCCGFCGISNAFFPAFLDFKIFEITLKNARTGPPVCIHCIVHVVNVHVLVHTHKMHMRIRVGLAPHNFRRPNLKVCICA